MSQRQPPTRRGRWLLLVAGVATVTAGLAGAGAAETPAGVTGPGAELASGLWPVVFEDGDHLVFSRDGDSSDGDSIDDDDPVDAKAGAAGGGVKHHDGFSTYNDATLLDHYEIRLVESAGIEELRPYVARAVGEASAAGGQSLELRAGTVAPTGPQRGQIDIVVSSHSPCGGMWLGCGGPNVEGGTIVSGQIWISPRAFRRPSNETANTVRHELGHTLGLAHYEYLHEDRVQTMHPTRFDAAAYESGDRAGLRFTAGNPHVEPPPQPQTEPRPQPQPVASAQPVGVVDAVKPGPFGIVVRGWAMDPDTAAPVTVTVTVDDVPADVVADRDRATIDGGRRSDAFEVVRFASPGYHEVCATAHDANGGPDAPLGCVSVTVSASSVSQLGVQTF